MPTVFITGASVGLGKATAILFAQNGWNVIATMRKPEAVPADYSAYSNIKFVKLDVTNLQNIEEVVATTLADTAVDVVVNNAGYGLIGPVEGTSDDVIQAQLNTNLLGVIRVTKAFTPHFRERNAGVFIAITSIGGHVTFPFNALYHSTKWALEGFSESLQFELSRFNIKVKNVAPGGILTEFAHRGAETMVSHEAYTEELNAVTAIFTDPTRRASYSTAEQIAQVVYEAATDGKDQVHYIAGADANALYAGRRQTDPETFRKGIQARFLGSK